MRSFIYDVVEHLIKEQRDFSNTSFILPSRRAGVFLRENLSAQLKKTIFSPEILSIEDFVEQVSDYKYISNSELLFQFYDVYIKNTPNDAIEPFDKFSKWAQILIQDFNEIDRYLIEPNRIFEYLSAIKQIENHHWSLDDSPTKYVENYLLFWKRLKIYYHDLKTNLSERGLGYQGMVYRDASENIELFSNQNSHKRYVFLGFNALNSAEDHIIQSLLKDNIAEVFWDIDEHFLQNPIHDAGLFIREHLKSWKYFVTNKLKWPVSFYKEQKNIQTIGVPKNIGQVKYVGELLSTFENSEVDLKKTAVVLGDESLLLPLLSSLPQSIESVNITMGLPLHLTPMASLFESLFAIHDSETEKIYYQDALSILNNIYLRPLITSIQEPNEQSLSDYIIGNNISYLTIDDLQNNSKSGKDIIKLLFSSWRNNPKIAIQNCKLLILKLKAYFDSDKKRHLLSLEYLFRFNSIFNELDNLNNKFSHLKSIKILHGLYRELIKQETLDFQGEPLQGLQIMGMLETRALDYETIIITSVNEGILPAGKTNNSFIPFDVKLENKLPTYKEKDAVYTYHFYRLLQRAKNVYILHNTEPDVLKGGEQSRFITQLQTEDLHDIKHKIISPKVSFNQTELHQIKKTPTVTAELDRLAKEGLSPSSLTNYIRNPIDFYLDKVLGVKESNSVEEHIAFNTLGTVVHNTLEDLYKPLEGQDLTIKRIEHMKTLLENRVSHHFANEYKRGDITKGKNLIIFEIAKRYVNNFLNIEISELNKGNSIKIISVEANSQVPLYIKSLNKTFILKGKVDRVDEYNGTTRIIDYKSGRVDQGKVEIVNWEDMLTDYDKYSKSFQVLMYAYMMHKNNAIITPLEAGIISFKNLNSGFLKFAKKPSSHSRTKDQVISTETLDSFEIQLKALISEIYNPEIPFKEKIIE